jgi:integrase
MSLYKRGKVYWSAIWIDGVRHMRSLETSNRRRAETIEQKIREELVTQRFQLPELQPEMSFGELYTRFLAEADVKPHHKERAKHFLGFFSEMPIGRITKNDIIRYRKLRQDLYRRSHPEAKPLSETTINRDVEVIRHLLYWAADEGFIQSNPLTRVRMVRERRTRRPVMSVADEVKLLAECAPHLRRIVVAALDTGMRRGEILNQLWEDVDFDRKVISVTHSKTAEGDHRLIPMTGRVHDMLASIRKPSGVIFTYEDEPLRRIKTAWAGAIRRSQIPHSRVHDLRHTFNSRLADLGVIADVRKELMGHSRGGDVHSIYTHLSLPTLREAIRKLEVWHTEMLRALETPEEASAPSPDRNLKTEPEHGNDDRTNQLTP